MKFFGWFSRFCWFMLLCFHFCQKPFIGTVDFGEYGAASSSSGVVPDLAALGPFQASQTKLTVVPVAASRVLGNAAALSIKNNMQPGVAESNVSDLYKSSDDPASQASRHKKLIETKAIKTFGTNVLSCPTMLLAGKAADGQRILSEQYVKALMVG